MGTAALTSLTLSNFLIKKVHDQKNEILGVCLLTGFDLDVESL